MYAVGNEFRGGRGLIPEGAEFTPVDIRSDGLTGVVREISPDAVAHLAAIHYIPYCNENPEEALDTNTLGTRNLLEALEGVEVDVDGVVYASTAAVYPPREVPHTETDETGPMDIYGKTKLLGEDLLELFQKRTGVPSAAARLFNVYGSRETNPHLIPAILEQLQDGNREVNLGNLSPKRDFVHVSDVARAIVAMLEGSEGYDAYNVGTGDTHSVPEVVERFKEALGEDVEILVDQGRVRESDRPHLQADITKIKDELGWRPRVEFSKGLLDLLGSSMPLAYLG